MSCHIATLFGAEGNYPSLVSALFSASLDWTPNLERTDKSLRKQVLCHPPHYLPVFDEHL